MRTEVNQDEYNAENLIDRKDVQIFNQLWKYSNDLIWLYLKTTTSIIWISSWLQPRTSSGEQENGVENYQPE